MASIDRNWMTKKIASRPVVLATLATMTQTLPSSKFELAISS